MTISKTDEKAAERVKSVFWGIIQKYRSIMESGKRDIGVYFNMHEWELVDGRETVAKGTLKDLADYVEKKCKLRDRISSW